MTNPSPSEPTALAAGPSPGLPADAMRKNPQHRPEADTIIAGGVSHRIADAQQLPARRATQNGASIVPPSGLSTLLLFFRSLTAPAMIVSASGLMRHKPGPEVC